MKTKYFLGIVSLAALSLASCSETWDDNPVLKTHEGEVKADFLNEPQMQSAPVMITEANSTSNLNLTCSQPDFGYAASAAYQVQMSLTEDFSTYQEIKQRFYDCAQINPLYSDVAATIETLSGVRSEADLPLPYKKYYVRLKAFVPQDPDHTTFISNVVSYDALSADYLAIWVSDVPVNMWVRGDMNGWGGGPYDPSSTTPADWQLVTGPEDDTWVTVKDVTIEAGQGFKIADESWGSINLGAGSSSVVTPGVSFALQNGDSGNLSVENDFTGKITVTLSDGIYYLMLTPAE